MDKSIISRLKPAQLPAVMLLLQITLGFTIIFDIPVARQVLGFIFLTLVPGITIVRLLKLKLERAETILFAAGLSIAFLMSVGLFMNFLGPLIGITKPLALIPLLLVTNIIVFLFLLREWHNSEKCALSTGYKKLTALGIVLIAFLALSIVGTQLVNTPPHTNNRVLLLMLIFISVLVGLAAFSRRLVSPEFYPLILFVVALVLLFHVSLFSNYIHGGDIFGEYSAFKLTLRNSYWNPTFSGKLYAMLSVTILPTIYSTVLGLEGTWILKIVYPLIFALVPVALYQLFKSRVSKEVAFFSVFFFVSNIVFFNEIAELARQMIAELFYVLLFLTIFNDNIKGSAKWLCFSFFSLGLVVSHYAMSYIFLASAFGLWLSSFLRKRKSKVTANMVIFFGVVAFAWYIHVSSSATFNALVGMLDHVRENFISDFLNPQSRGSQVLQGTGLQGLETFWHIVGRYVYYATELLVVIGWLALLMKRKRSFFDDEYNIMTFLNMSLVVACIVVPNLATSFNMTRIYHIALFFLAPFCVLGGVALLNLLSRKRVKDRYLSLIVVLIVIIPYFFFQTGFVYEVTGEESWSLPLSAHRFSILRLSRMGVIGEGEVSGAIWLSQFRELNRNVYADITSGTIFAYGSVQNSVWLSFGVPVVNGSYVYLRQYNVYDGVVFSSYGSVGLFNVTQIVPSLDGTNVIYSSGSCQIYKVPPKAPG